MAQYTPKTWTTGETITAAELNAIEAAAAAAAVKADADAAYDAKGAATAAQAAAVQRANHTGTQSADTLTDGTTNKAYTAAEKTKLAGVATAATANSTDAQLRDRSTHTGTQAASTITGLPTQYTDAQAVSANASALASKANIADVGTAGTATGDALRAAYAPSDSAIAAAQGALPAVTDFRYLRGINTAGGEFSANSGTTLPGVQGSDYAYNTLPLMKYLRSRGHRIVRLPFSWERIQHTLSGPLDPTGIAELQAAVKAASDAGLLVLLDMHNYGSYYRLDDVQVSLNNGITQADFTDAWTRLVGALGDQRCIAGWGLMNEPNGLTPIAVTYAKTSDLHTFDSTTESWQATNSATLSVGTYPGMTGAGALQASAVLTANSGNFNSLFRINSPSGGPVNSTSFPAGTYLEWEVYVPASTPGTVRVRPELTDGSSVSQVGTYATPTKGQVTKVYYPVPAGLTGLSHKNISMQIEVNGSDGTTPTVIEIGNISYGPGSGGQPAWQAYSQAAVTAIRATGDTRPIFVCGDSFASASRWTVANGSTPWITDPANNIVYEAHYYFAPDNSGVYPSTYAALETDATSRGWANLAARVTQELHTFTDWVTANGVTGFIGEIGWPLDSADAASYNAIGELLYGILDAAGIGATQWAAGTRWSSGYRLQTYAYDATHTVFTPNPQAGIVEAHRSKTAYGRLDAANKWTGTNDFTAQPTVNGSPFTAAIPATRPHIATLHNLVGVSLDPAIASSTGTMTAGTAKTTKIAALPGATVSSVIVPVTTAAAGTTDSVAVYNSSGVQLAAAGGTGLLFGSATVVTVPVTPFTVPADGILIVAILTTGGTAQPAFRSSTSTAGSSNNVGLSGSQPMRSGTIASLASLPATLTTQTAASPVLLVAVN